MSKMVALCVLVCLSAWGADTEPAVQQAAVLQKSAHEARLRGDMKVYVASVEKLAELMHGSGPSQERLVLAYTAAGDSRRAMAALTTFASMGQADDELIASPAVAVLKGLPQFEQAAKQMKLAESAVSQATQVLRLQDAGLVAEDIDYDAQTKVFYVTSVLEHKIVRLDAKGGQSDFARAPDDWPMLAIKIDAKRGVVWATEAALDGFAAAPKADWGRSALVCFKLADGSVLRRIEGPAHSALGDMALTSAGDAIVSDGAGGGVYWVKAGTGNLERIDGGDFISPQTPTMTADGKHIFVPDYARGIAVLDAATKQARWIDGAGKHALQGIDGLYFKNGALIATQNGSSPERVVRFQLDAPMTRVVAEQIIERATPTLGDPTHGVIVGDDFYYIANSGWSELDEHGAVKAGGKLTAARIMKAELTMLH